MKRLSIIALITTIWSCTDQPKVSPVKPELVIISDNETGNPMLFAIEESYNSIGAHQLYAEGAHKQGRKLSV